MAKRRKRSRMGKLFLFLAGGLFMLALGGIFLSNRIGSTTDAAGNLTVTVVASENAYRGDAQMGLIINGGKVAQSTVTANHSYGQWQTIQFQVAQPASLQSIGVSFLNESWGGSLSSARNLYIQNISVNNYVLTPGRAKYILTNGATMPASGAMFWNGTLTWNASLIPTGSSPLTINVQSYGAKGDGSDATTAIAKAIQQISASGGGTLLFPPGNYVISSPNYLTSNTQMLCQKGAVITAAPASSWSGGAITTAFTATSVSNLEISGCQFKFPYGNPNYGPGGYAHILEFISSSHINIHDNSFDGGGDSVAVQGTTDTREESNKATNVSNSCYDHWAGFTDAHTNGNYCSTLSSAGGGLGAIQFTGINTDQTPANSNGFEAIGNVVFMNNANSPQCFIINGHNSGGTNDNGKLTGNMCIVTGNNATWGILMYGHASNGDIAGNIFENNKWDFAAVGVYDPAINWNVHDNTAINWASGGHSVFESTEKSGQFVNNSTYSSCANTPLPTRIWCLATQPGQPQMGFSWL